MSNKIVLKKSSVAAKVPLTTDIDYGELAINYADGKLYYKTSGATIDHIPSTSSTSTLTNKTLTSPTINSGALSGTFSGAITLSDTTASTSTTTGALKIGGGLGVAGVIYADKIYLTNNGGGTNVAIGDDAWIGDVNSSNTIAIRGQQDSTQGYIVFGSSNNTAYIGRSGTNPITVTGQFSINSGTVSGSNAIALQISGYAGKGGVGYHDFLSVTNSYGSATNPNKFFRLDSAGTLQIINSAYTANIFNLTDAGTLTVAQISAGGSTGTSGQVLQSTGTGMQWATIAGSGTVTSIVAGTGLTGGTITTTGTLAIDTTVVATLSGTQTLTNKTISGSSNTLSNIPNSALTNSTISGVALGSNLNALTIGTGLSGTSYNGSGAVTIAIDSTVATLTGTQTLSNKSLAAFDQKTGTTSIANQAVTQTILATTAATAVDTFPIATYRSVKYIVQITQGTNYQVSEIMMIHNGTTVTMTEYGVMATNGSLGIFTSDINTGNARLLLTLTSSTSATINITRTTIVV